ncbi:FAD-dependent oxidoreductase [Herbidospora mongoliensis]|uniref:FAD-dependent oxidoreductase n=1 Tax=Herbidospora mongoliensis TaxID=688067 RepID=UPI0008311AD0|nr:NAD(P)/FAD-dependent oxidoreductase [Herbidospora mongoliensis]
MKVLIIGAGLGGLCLAQGLRGSGIDVEVFERRHDRTVDLQGYGIHLNEAGCAALRASLPAAVWALIDERAGQAGATSGFYDQRLRRLTRIGNGAQGRRRSVGRSVLRDLLLTGLADDTVRWGKEFLRYEELPNGQVRAHFADGGHADGDLLVGADASNSRVRAQRLPQLRREDLGVISIAGRTAMTDEATAGLPRAILDGTPNSVVPAGPGWMFVCTWSGGPADGPYVVWAYIGSRAGFPDGVEERSGTELRDLVLSRIATWSPALTTLVRHGDPGSVAPVVLRSMPRLESWPSGNVTLLGDAAHNMTPMAGMGANTALRDAAALRRILLDVHAGHRALLAAVSSYEEEMRGWANAALAASRRNAESAGTTNRLARGTFRVLLRVADRVPAVKKAVFERPSS